MDIAIRALPLASAVSIAMEIRFDTIRLSTLDKDEEDEDEDEKDDEE